jgi:hypothetical protein
MQLDFADDSWSKGAPDIRGRHVNAGMVRREQSLRICRTAD